MNRNFFRLVAATTLLVFVLLGCGDDKPTEPRDSLDPAGQVPDFAIVDVNPNSSTANQSVSPRNYVDKVSAWYFGHAT
ncbi:MAG: hypothetical protein ACKVU1_13365 [bacterium]